MSPAENFEAAKAALFAWRDAYAPGTHACLRMEFWHHPTATNGRTDSAITFSIATHTRVIASVDVLPGETVAETLGRLAADKATREAALAKVRREIAEAAAMAEKGVA